MRLTNNGGGSVGNPGGGVEVGAVVVQGEILMTTTGITKKRTAPQLAITCETNQKSVDSATITVEFQSRSSARTNDRHSFT